MTVDALTFDPDDLGPVVAALGPGGWVNLRPEVAHEDDAPSSSGPLFGIFGSRGPTVPLGTWLPGERSAGIQHATGPKLARRIEVPTGWRVAQDHPRRGLVVQVPDGTTDEAVLRWLVETAGPLCTVPRLGPWVAEVHR